MNEIFRSVIWPAELYTSRDTGMPFALTGNVKAGVLIRPRACGRRCRMGRSRLTSRRKPYPFALPVIVDKVEGAVLADHLKSMDWAARKAVFHPQADPALLSKVRAYAAVLLGIR